MFTPSSLYLSLEAEARRHRMMKVRTSRPKGVRKRRESTMGRAIFSP